MTRFSDKLVRQVFAAGEHISPALTGRAAFELFCRTPGSASLTKGERRAVERASAFMNQARHHRLPTSSGCAMLHEFRPQGKDARGSVLVIHGWRSRTEYMNTLIEGLLEAGYRVLSLDLPGHGGSLGRRLNMALAVEAVRRAADWFGPFTAMVGHSFGGAVAVNAAVGSVEGLAPVAVDRLVTIASPSSLPKLFADFGRMLKLGPRSQSMVEAQVERLTGRGIAEFDSARQLLRVPLPTLVIHDADDREVSVDEARSTARAGNHVRLHVTKGLGHRRIITDQNVVRETVGFVGAAAEPALLH
ncbi:MAG: alpha/beta hydrolase [Rhizobiaceae bacterium]